MPWVHSRVTASCWSVPSDATVHATATASGASAPVWDATPDAIASAISVSNAIRRRVVNRCSHPVARAGAGRVVDGDDLRVREHSGRQPIDFGRGAAGGEDGGDCLGDFVAGERRVRPDQPVTDERDELIDIHLLDHRRAGGRGEQDVEFGLSPAGGLGFLLPADDDALGVDRTLGLAGRQGRFLGCFRTGSAEAFELGFDLVAALGEQPDDLSRDAGDLARVLHRWGPLDAEPFGELATERGLEHDAGGALRPVEAGPVEG